MVTNFEVMNIRTNLFHNSCNFMSGVQLQIYQFKEYIYDFYLFLNISKGQGYLRLLIA